MPAEERSRWMAFVAAFLLPVLCCLLVRAWVVAEPIDPFWLLEDRYDFLLLIVLYPVVEELSFRGVIQGGLLSWTHHRMLVSGLSVANVITSLLFVAIHFVYHPPVWAVAVVIPSLVFGYFRDRFESVVPAVFLHAFYNFIFYATVGK